MSHLFWTNTLTMIRSLQLGNSAFKKEIYLPGRMLAQHTQYLSSIPNSTEYEWKGNLWSGFKLFHWVLFHSQENIFLDMWTFGVVNIFSAISFIRTHVYCFSTELIWTLHEQHALEKIQKIGRILAMDCNIEL